MFQPSIVAIFWEVFYEGRTTKNITTNLQIYNISLKYKV